MEGMQKAFRLYESLVYALNVVAEKEADATTKVFIEGWATVNPGDLEREKNTVLHLQKALKYMNYHKILPSDHFALPLVEAIVKAQGWSKK
jgi:hypothetical protein